MDAIPWWWSLVTLILGACIGGGLVAVIAAGASEDAYRDGYRDGTDWADLEDSRG